jgi:colanic acid/amylovoran biosynthesis glycosyltransferase
VSGTWSASVVIPAHNEERPLSRCLEYLRGHVAAETLDLVVVANGCDDRTAEVARSFAPSFPGLQVLELEQPSKVAALNAGDAVARGFPRIYLDADIQLGPEALAGLIDALSVDAPRVASPHVRFDYSDSEEPVRAFYRVFEHLPYVRRGLIGLGVYGLSTRGRARFGDFPDVTGDDLFVQRLFRLDERITTPGYFVVTAPRTVTGLLAVRTRIAAGNVELGRALGDFVDGAHLDTSATRGDTARALGVAVVSGRVSLRDAARYTAMTARARGAAKRSRGLAKHGWLRDESTRLPVSVPSEASLRVAYLVSQYPAPSHIFIEREIAGLRSLGAEVHTFSVRPTPHESLLSESMALEGRATQVLQADKAAIMSDLLALVGRRPLVAAAGLAQALSSGDSTARAKVWQAFYFAEAARLHSELRRVGLRHIHVHFANNGADIARLAVAIGRAIDGPAAGWRWSLSIHGPTEFEAVEKVDLAAKLQDAAAVACISDFTRSQVMRQLDPSEWPKLCVVRMAVDTARYQPGAGRRREGPLRILDVGRLVPEKGAPVLLDAVAKVLSRGTDVEVKIVGDGPLRQALVSQISRLGLGERVELLGPLGQDELPKTYQWADVFCLPSFQEGLPVVLMEAMASGLPVVTSAVAGIPELVDGTNGFLLPAGRADLIADALEQLASDPERRRELGRAGRQRVVRDHAMDLTASDMLRFLSDVGTRSGA